MTKKTRFNLLIKPETKLFMKKFIPKIGSFVDEVVRKAMLNSNEFNMEHKKIIKDIHKKDFDFCVNCEKKIKDLDNWFIITLTEEGMKELNIKEKEQTIMNFCRECFFNKKDSEGRTWKDIIEEDQEHDIQLFMFFSAQKYYGFLAQAIIEDKLKMQFDRDLSLLNKNNNKTK